MAGPWASKSLVRALTKTKTLHTGKQRISESPKILEQNLTDFNFKRESYQKTWDGEQNCQCPDLRDHQRLLDQDSMSQKPSASQPASYETSESEAAILPPIQLSRDAVQARDQGGGREEQQDYGLQPLIHHQRPPSSMQSSQIMTSRDDPPVTGSSRGLGVYNILNPLDREVSERSNAHVTSGGSGSPHPGRQHQQQVANPFTPAPRGNENQEIGSPTAAEYSASGSHSRKMLIPKSPRAASRTGVSMTDAQQSPFISDRTRIHTVQPGSAEVPPMPNLSSALHQPYNLPPSASMPSLHRRASIATMAAPGRTPVSQSASPSPSFSSYSGPSQASPATRFPAPQPPGSSSYFPGSSFSTPLQSGSPSQTLPPVTEGPYMTPQPESIFYRGSPSGGHNSNIRMMPISTEQGPFFMPVDVQAASKNADEKRARNAGASARFRQRRKEKEKEASTNIQKLEQQSRDLERRLREAEQERDFYRSERDRFRDVVYRTPSTREFALQSPPSPRITRNPGYQPPLSNQSYQTSDIGTAQEVERPPRRRRTDTGGDYPYGSSPIPNNPPGQSAGYVPTSTSAPSQAPLNIPPLRMENVTGPPPGSMSAPAIPPPPARPSFENYPRSAYDRAWPGPPPEDRTR